MLTLNRCHSRRCESIRANGRLRAHVQVVDLLLIPKTKRTNDARAHRSTARLKAIFVGFICVTTWLISCPVDERMGIKYNEEIGVIRASTIAARVTKFPRTKLGSLRLHRIKIKSRALSNEAWIFMINIWILQTAVGNAIEESSLSFLEC